MTNINKISQDDEYQLQAANKKVVILGGGYVGTTLANYWHQKQKHNITVTTTRQERLAELESVANRVIVLKGEDSQNVKSLLQNQDLIVSCIAPISDRQVDAKAYRDTYIPTANNLVSALKESQHFKQLIYLSSCSVYGNKNGESVDETSPVDSTNEYNQILSEAEQILLDAAHENLVVTILRLGGIYGPKRELEKRLAKISGKTMPGRGDTPTYWVHVDDIVAAIEFLSLRKMGGIYNLVNDLELTIQELCDLVCQQQNLPLVLWDDTQPSYRFLNARVSNQKIKSAGYQFIYPETII